MDRRRRMTREQHQDFWTRSHQGQSVVGIHRSLLLSLSGAHGIVRAAGGIRRPPRTRAAIVLRHWLDLSEQRTAELLGCGVGTVKSLVSRGLATLREEMGHV